MAINKLLLPITIISSSLILGGFYYASELNKQASIERQKQIEIDQKKQEQTDKDLKAREAKEDLSKCIAGAEEDYHDTWNKECKTRGLLTEECVSLDKMTFDEYAEKNNIPQDKRLDAISVFYDKKNECSCSLILSVADRIDTGLEKDKENCFKKYPQ